MSGVFGFSTKVRQPVDLEAFLEREVYPRLFDNLDTAFPEYGFRRKGDRWEASNTAARALPGSPRPDRVQCYRNSLWGLVVQGGGFVRFLDLVNGGAKPTGEDFPQAVRKLADMAGVAFPELEVSPEEADHAARRHARRSVLDTVTALCRERLTSSGGDAARRYLEERGLDAAAQEALGIGLYPPPQDVLAALRSAGHDADASAENVVSERMAGFVVFPWADATGQPMTLYSRWPGAEPPKGLPKNLALPGEGTKASPLYLDRARRAGHKDIVLVEGLFDAALPQALGETNVVACMGSQLSAAQLDTLERHGIRSVTICLDPDGAGEKGTLACIRGLYGKGINAYVTPLIPDGMDPDEFILRDGLDAWRDHIRRAEHAFRYQARTMCQRHMGGEWTDRSLTDCLDEAISFDNGVQNPEHITALDLYFWPEVHHWTGTDMDAIQARVGAAREKAEQDRERRAYEELVREAGDRLRTGDVTAAKDLLREQTDKLRTVERHWKAEPVRSVADELVDHEERLQQWRGKEFIGLPQRTLPKLDEMTRGLRGLMLLAAAPNVGKTAFSVQIGLDAVVHNDDAAFLFVSLEMSRWDMLTRFKSRLSGLDWKTLVFGSVAKGVHGFEPGSFTPKEYESLQQAEHTLRDIGPRIRILDDKNFPAPTLEKVLDQIADLKATTGAKRVFVLVDYLQVWPVPDALARTLRTDNDADKWRIGQMKELRDAVGGDPVLVISEARKPNDKDEAWGGGLSDVMGSARGTYTPDIVFLLSQVSDTELAKREGAGDKDKDKPNEGRKIREREADEGFASQCLKIVKGRDGVQRGSLDLRFYFYRSQFEEQSDASWGGR